jgi:hypothetical protein
MQLHGAFDFPSVPVLRFYDGEAGGSQETGDATIAYKNQPVEIISDHMPIRVPAVGVQQANTGATFDGTAMWLGHSRFNNGAAPALGGNSGPNTGTRWPDGAIATANGGQDARTTAANTINIPVVTGQITNYSFVYVAQVYVPDHSADRDGVNAISNALRIGAEIDREGFGLRPIGGTDAGVGVTLTTNNWHEIAIRGDFTINGGATSSNSDDSGTALVRVYRDGIFAGSTGGALDPAWMTTRFGDVHFAAHFWLQRGWQGSAPEAFIDSLYAYTVLAPEPMSAGVVLLAGILAAGRRMRRH